MEGYNYVKNSNISLFFYICPLFLPGNGTSTKLSIKAIDHSECLCLSLSNRKNEDGGKEFYAFLEPNRIQVSKKHVLLPFDGWPGTSLICLSNICFISSPIFISRSAIPVHQIINNVNR